MRSSREHRLGYIHRDVPLAPAPAHVHAALLTPHVDNCLVVKLLGSCVMQVAKLLRPYRFAPNDVLCRAGDASPAGKRFFVVQEGAVSMMQAPSPEVRRSAILSLNKYLSSLAVAFT